MNILNAITMAHSVQRTGKSQSEGRTPLIEEVRQAVCEFLKQQPDVREVRVTKLVQIDAETGYWEAEADVYVPNETIRALALPVRKEVLDRKAYLLRVDGRLSIVAYGLRDLVEERT